jgi:hypothetical protein
MICFTGWDFSGFGFRQVSILQRSIGFPALDAMQKETSNY